MLVLLDFNTTGTAGTINLWIGFGFFVTGSTVFLFSAIIAKSSKVRSFSITNCIINAVAATAYYTMARHQGYTLAPSGRWIIYVRYIDWAITTPLILLDIANLAGASLGLTILIMAFDEFMIILGLASVLSTDDGTKWGWYALACVAFAPILYMVLVDYHKYKRSEVKTAYFVQSWYLAALWIVYPIAVGLGSEGEVISSDAETIWITWLDVSAKTLFGSMLLILFRQSLPYGEGLRADYPSSLPRHADYDEMDPEGLDPKTTTTYPIRRSVLGASSGTNGNEVPMAATKSAGAVQEAIVVN